MPSSNLLVAPAHVDMIRVETRNSQDASESYGSRRG